MPIPKIIHLCWFGSGKPNRKIESCLRTIEKLSKLGYKINFWTEKNYNVYKSTVLKDAYDNGRWSLVSNFVRVDLLNKYGGIYLDTDIEIVKDFDSLLENNFFIGFIWDCSLSTAVIASEPGHTITRGILDRYESNTGQLVSPNNDTFTEYFLDNVDGFALNGREQSIDGIRIFDKYKFEHPSLFLRHNFTVHHFAQSWRTNSAAKRMLKRLLISVFSLWLYRKYICWNSHRKSKFYSRYLGHAMF